MLADGDQPKVGNESKMLGVRIAPHPQADIAVDPNGDVHPNTGGMSVAPDWRQLPYFLIPRRLKALIPDARGSNHLVCWTLGQGLFEAGLLTNELALRLDPDKPEAHGFVEPSQSVNIHAYQAAIAQTQSNWTREEN
jgi:hypothetical protein